MGSDWLKGSSHGCCLPTPPPHTLSSMSFGLMALPSVKKSLRMVQASSGPSPGLSQSVMKGLFLSDWLIWGFVSQPVETYMWCTAMVMFMYRLVPWATLTQASLGHMKPDCYSWCDSVPPLPIYETYAQPLLRGQEPLRQLLTPGQEVDWPFLPGNCWWESSHRLSLSPSRSSWRLLSKQGKACQRD